MVAVLAALETADGGLTDAVVDRRRKAFGANLLPRMKRRSVLVVYLAQFKSPLIYLPAAAAAVSLAIGELTDALFIFAVLQINAVIGTVQEWRAETSAEALQGLIHNQAVVVRDGLRREVDSVELVPGDIVRLESGSLVPADIRLLAGPRPQTRQIAAHRRIAAGWQDDPDASLDEQTPVGDRGTMIHAGRQRAQRPRHRDSRPDRDAPRRSPASARHWGRPAPRRRRLSSASSGSPARSASWWSSR